MQEETLEIPKLEEPKSLAELIEQMAIISEAIGKCEKILQYLAIGTDNTDFSEFMSKHIRLTSMKNALYEKMKVMIKQGSKDAEVILS